MSDTTTRSTTARPSAGRYALEGAHTTVGFSVRHLGVSRVRGTFTDVAGELVVGDRVEDSHVDVTIRADSIDTRNADRDAHLTSPDFLDVAHHPTLRFVSTGVRQLTATEWAIDGDLTIRGTTRPVTLTTSYEGQAADPTQDGAIKVGFIATTAIDREDFGLTWNVAVDSGGLLVGKQVSIQLEVEAVRV